MRSTTIDAWRTASNIMARRHPDFPLAAEVAKRIADHHEARLPIGYESIPIIDVWDPEPAGVAKRQTIGHHGRGLSREEART